MQIDSSWSTQSAISNTGLNNTTFLLKFKAETTDNDEHFRVDGVLVTGDLIPTTGSISVTKTAVGGDGTFDFTVATSATAIAPFTITTATGTGTTTITSLNPGSYTITETAEAGWDTTLNTCTVTVTAGNTETCNFTNTKRGSITIIKNVVDPSSGEVADSQTFTIHKDGETGQTISEGNNVVYSDLLAGTYVITEDANDNYVTEIPSIEVVLATGQDATITFTNKQKQATLTIQKIVTHPNGGLETAGQFSFSLDGESSTAFIENESNPLMGENVVLVNPGAYTVTETVPLGNYAISYTNCSGTIASNGSATCVITNSDITAGFGAITVIKNLPNDNGGTFAVENFPLKVTSVPAPESEESAITTNMSHGISTFFAPGDYVVSEENPGDLIGFTESISCVSGETVVASGNITLANQQSWVCTITNDDQPGQLTIIKNTGNESHNGTFEFTITGQENASITTTAGTGQTAPISLNKGSYNVVEVVPGGWSFSSASCLYDGESAGSEIANGKSIYIGNGRSITCTFTNTRQTGSLTVIKVVEGGGETVTASSFSIHVMQGETEVAGSPQPGSASEGTTYTGLPTGSYTITETGGPSNFVATFSENCPAGVITVTNSESPVTCTITNTFVPVVETPQPTPTPAPVPASSGGGGGGGRSVALLVKIGDINKDGKVDELDYAMLLADWSSNSVRSDLNKDGIVNELDLAILMFNWGL